MWGKEVFLKDGRKILIRKPEVKDAEELARCLSEIFTTDCLTLARYPEEREITAKAEMAFIENLKEDSRSIFLIAQDGERIIGTCHFSAYNDSIKMRHRAECAVSVAKKYRNLGLATHLMKEGIREVKDLSYEQVELEVVSTNRNAIKLYEKLGFKKVGTTPNGFKEKDGSYQDLDKMVLFL